LNHVFQLLSEQHIRVSSMRNKANRLEELFVKLLHNPETETTEKNKTAEKKQ